MGGPSTPVSPITEKYPTEVIGKNLQDIAIVCRKTDQLASKRKSGKWLTADYLIEIIFSDFKGRHSVLGLGLQLFGNWQTTCSRLHSCCASTAQGLRCPVPRLSGEP